MEYIPLLQIDTASLSVVVGAILATGSLIMATITLRANTSRDAILLNQNAQVLLETANKSTVDMLNRRVELLENDNVELRRKVDDCAHDKEGLHNENTELRDRNYELMERILGLTQTVTHQRNNPVSSTRNNPQSSRGRQNKSGGDKT